LVSVNIRLRDGSISKIMIDDISRIHFIMVFENASSSNRMYEVILHFTKIPSIMKFAYGKLTLL